MFTKSKLRIGFISLMYIVFIVLWADSLYEQELAQEIIAKQEAFIAKHQVLTAKYDKLFSDYINLGVEHNYLKEIDGVKTEYINGFGYKIDWNKAIKLKKQRNE